MIIEKRLPVKAFKFLDTETEIYPMIKSSFVGEYFYISEYFGDHNENWIIKYDKDGKEIERHNTRAIDTIMWRG